MKAASATLARKAGSECIAISGCFGPGNTALYRAATAFRGAIRCYCTGSGASMSVDITRHNFKDALPTVREALEKCTFYALDCEMTGLFTDGNKHEYLDDMQARYTKLTESSKSYIITQYGLSCFEATGPNSYQARTFNFYLFPQPHGTYNRKFLCDASSMVFLAQHGFDFNKCISQGVPYMPIRTRDFQLLQVNRSSEPREPVVATNEKDAAFVADLIQLVKDWLAGNMPSSSNLVPNGSALAASAANGVVSDEDHMGTSADEDDPAAVAAALAKQQHEELALPMLNGFQRLLAFQELSKPQFGVEGHPGFWIKRLADNRYLVLVRATPQQAEQYEAEAKAARIAAIHDAAGFAAVFDLMRRSGKPVVGHNCMFDVAYGLYSFADAYLPSTWRDYKKMVNAWHPGGIYDTKYIAKQLPEVFGRDTSLATVYTELMHNDQSAGIQQLLQAAAATENPAQMSSISHAAGFDKYKSLAPGEAAHEAGYDAFMTGAAFARLLPLAAGKVAADSSSELTVTYKAAREAATAAVDGSSQQASPLLPPPSPLAQQQQQVGQQQPSIPTRNPLQYVQGVVGRLNLTFTDMAYAALRGSDPVPQRPNIFYLSGLPAGYRPDEVWKMLAKQGLGSVRITPLDSSSCLAEFQAEFAPAVLPTLATINTGLVATTWAEYAAMRYSRKLPDQLEAANGAADGPSRGVKRARVDETAAATAAAAAAAATAAAAARQSGGSRSKAWGGDASAGSESEDNQQATQSRCTIM